MQTKKGKMCFLSFQESARLLNKYSISLPSSQLIKSKDGLIRSSKRIGYPQAMKIVSRDIIHKSDVKGVKTGINNEKEAFCAYDNILKNIRKNKPDARIDGILIQKMFSGTEIIIGMKRDRQFGPVLLFGLGGIFVEIMKDVSMRIAPVTKSMAIEMIKSIKGIPLLLGARGTKPSDIGKIADIIVKLSLLSLNEEKIKEIDLNPVIVDGSNINIVDVRIIAEK